MSNLTLSLWFDGQAEDAARFYVGAFEACGRPASLGSIVPWGEVGPGPKGSVLTVDFTLDGQKILALNGGPHFTFTPAISLIFECTDQADLDRVWDALVDGGTPGQCGWLTDRFGVSWQIVPATIGDMMHDPDPARRDRVMSAFMPMQKLDVAAIQRAFDGG